jgi:MFS family permease
LAIGVLSGAAIAVGNVSAPWLARGLIDHFGWRGAYLGFCSCDRPRPFRLMERRRRPNPRRAME